MKKKKAKTELYFLRSLPKIDISAHHTDTAVPAKNSHRKIKCCNDSYQANWIPLLKKCVTRTWYNTMQEIKLT